MIVAAVDRPERSARVVSEARALAASFGEELHVVHVLAPMQAKKLRKDAVADTAPRIGPTDGHELATGIAADAVAGAGGAADGITTVGLVGKASEEVIGYAREHDARYVVVGGGKRSPASKAIFGSVTQAILLHADRPVLTVPRKKVARHDRGQ